MYRYGYKYNFPELSEKCVLIPIDVQLVPLLSGRFTYLEDEYSWQTPADHQNGYNTIAEIYICMSQCTQSLQQSIDRLYRLIDHIHTGTLYTAQDIDGVLEIDPPIPPVPDARGATPDSLLGLLRDLPGVLDAGWFGIGGRPATLADVVNALRSSAPEVTADIFDQARQLLDAGNDVANIADFVRGVLDEGTDVVGDAGQLLMLAALGASQTAMSQQLVARLDRLIAGLDGGGTAPTDSVLRALRGDNPANAERNVIDALAAGGGGVTPADIDRIIAELQQIKAAL